MVKLKHVSSYAHDNIKHMFKNFHDKENKVKYLEMKIKKAKQDLLNAQKELPEVKEDFKKYKEVLAKVKKDPRFIYTEKDSIKYDDYRRGKRATILSHDDFVFLDLVWYLDGLIKDSDGNYRPSWRLNTEHEGRDNEYYGRGDFVWLEHELYVARCRVEDNLEEAEEIESYEEDYEYQLGLWKDWLAREYEYLGLPKSYVETEGQNI